MSTKVLSPNTQMMPVSATILENGHLAIGGMDTVELAKKWGTPLWIVDFDTVKASCEALKNGLAHYPNALPLYAGKAFMNLAMVKLTNSLGLGLDVVSDGELFTALKAEIPPDKIYMHGNNKSADELKMALDNPGVTVIVDGFNELSLLTQLASGKERSINIMVRVTPGVEPDTHEYIKTGQADSKFGISLQEVIPFIKKAKESSSHIKFKGIHAHIGSQSLELEPYLQLVEVLASLALEVKEELGVEIEKLNLGGGLGIVYVEGDKPLPLYEWSNALSKKVKEVFPAKGLTLPVLLVEPGRSVVGTAGITLYSVGHTRKFDTGKTIIAVDGGMADNPRPATYNARYTARIANRMNAPKVDSKVEVVGRYCESGDIIIKEASIEADMGDIVAVFATGAYNYSMASNYNRTRKPACILVKDGVDELIIKRESLEDLVRQDILPEGF